MSMLLDQSVSILRRVAAKSDGGAPLETYSETLAVDEPARVMVSRVEETDAAGKKQNRLTAAVYLSRDLGVDQTCCVDWADTAGVRRRVIVSGPAIDCGSAGVMWRADGRVVEL